MITLLASTRGPEVENIENNDHRIGYGRVIIASGSLVCGVPTIVPRHLVPRVISTWTMRSMDDESDDSLAREVTVVLATSYTAACPSTNLIEAVVRSFGFVPGLDACRLIVVCDGFRVSIRQRLKQGRMLQEDVGPYTAYKVALRELAARAARGESPGGAWSHAHILELSSHHGFSWAVKAALESGLVQTRQILVVQHDRAFMQTFDLLRAVRCMRADHRVRYLLLPTRSTHHHAQTAFGRTGVRLPHIEVLGTRLLQLAFWWDSTHLATAEHYTSFVFHQRCVKRGTFPEDTLGKQMLSAIKQHGLSAATPYHAYLWDDEDDAHECRVVGHLNGKHWRAWTDEPSENEALPNSRLAHFHRSLAALPSFRGQRGKQADGCSAGPESGVEDADKKGKLTFRVCALCVVAACLAVCVGRVASSRGSRLSLAIIRS